MWFWVNATSNDVTSSGLNAMTILNSGKIGIGTASPTEKLEVQDGFIGKGTTPSAAVGAGYAISSYTNTTGSTKNTIGIFGVSSRPPTHAKVILLSNLANDGAPTEVMRVNRAGAVGIGTTTPGAALDVRSSGITRIQAVGRVNKRLRAVNRDDRRQLQFLFRVWLLWISLHWKNTRSGGRQLVVLVLGGFIQ